MSLKIFTLLFLSLATILFFNFCERYVVTGPELLQNPQFLDGLDKWQHSSAGVSLQADGSGAIVLRSQDPSALTHITQTIPEPQRFHLLRFTADLKTHEVQKGDASWKTARLVLVSLSPGGKGMYYLPHTLVGKYGDTGWNHYEKVFRVNEDVSEMSLSAQLMRATGSMWVKNISLKPVSEREGFSRYRMLMMWLWFLAIAWVIAAFVRAVARSPSGLVVMLVALCIAAGALLPEFIKKDLDHSLPAALFPVEQASPLQLRENPAPGPVRSFPPVNIYKLGHFALFTILSVVVLLSGFRDVPILRRIGYLLLFALITEVLQLFVEGREARIMDLFLDAGGIVTGAAVSRLFAALARNRAKTT